MQCGFGDQTCNPNPNNILQSQGSWNGGKFNLTCANGAIPSLVTVERTLSPPNSPIPYGKYVNMTFKLPPECFSGCSVCAPGTYGPRAVGVDSIDLFPSTFSGIDFIWHPSIQLNWQGVQDASGCEYCPSGTYTSSYGEYICQDCEAGKAQPEYGQQSCSTICPAGWLPFRLVALPFDFADPGPLTPPPPPPTLLLLLLLETAQQPTGKFSEGGSSSCSDCPRGRFGTARGQTKMWSACTKCPVGSYQDEFGATLSCTPCIEEGAYCPEGASKPEICRIDDFCNGTHKESRPPKPSITSASKFSLDCARIGVTLVADNVTLLKSITIKAAKLRLIDTLVEKEIPLSWVRGNVSIGSNTSQPVLDDEKVTICNLHVGSELFGFRSLHTPVAPVLSLSSCAFRLRSLVQF